MTNVKNKSGNLKIFESSFKKRRKYKLTRKGKIAVLTAAAITVLTSLGIMLLNKSNAQTFEQPISAIVETIKDETVFDEIAALTGINFEEIDQIYANTSTYGTISQEDMSKVESLGINAIKASIMDAYNLDVSSYDEVSIMPSNVGNNSIEGDKIDTEMYCVIKVGDQTINVKQYDSFMNENEVYSLAQDVYRIQTYKQHDAREQIQLNENGVKQIENLIDNSKEVISNNYKLKNILFSDDLQLKTSGRR